MKTLIWIKNCFHYSDVVVALAAAWVGVLLVLVLQLTAVVRFGDEMNASHRLLRGYEDAARLLARGSDNLTHSVRRFAVLRNVESMGAYFKEANFDRNRDHAFERIAALSNSVEILGAMRYALTNSVDLMRIEYRSMKLAAMSAGMDLADLPPEVRTARLDPEEMSLSPEGQHRLAESLVFDADYDSYKNRIGGGVAKAVSAVLAREYAKYDEASRELHLRYREMMVSLAACVILLLALVIISLTCRSHS